MHLQWNAYRELPQEIFSEQSVAVTDLIYGEQAHFFLKVPAGALATCTTAGPENVEVDLYGRWDARVIIFEDSYVGFTGLYEADFRSVTDNLDDTFTTNIRHDAAKTLFIMVLSLNDNAQFSLECLLDIPVNTPPVISGNMNPARTVGKRVPTSFAIMASDQDSDPLTMTLVQNQAQAFSLDGFLLKFASQDTTGKYIGKVMVSDGKASVYFTATVTVFCSKFKKSCKNNTCCDNLFCDKTTKKCLKPVKPRNEGSVVVCSKFNKSCKKNKCCGKLVCNKKTKKCLKPCPKICKGPMTLKRLRFCRQRKCFPKKRFPKMRTATAACLKPNQACWPKSLKKCCKGFVCKKGPKVYKCTHCPKICRDPEKKAQKKKCKILGCCRCNPEAPKNIAMCKKLGCI